MFFTGPGNCKITGTRVYSRFFEIAVSENPLVYTSRIIDRNDAHRAGGIDLSAGADCKRVQQISVALQLLSDFAKINSKQTDTKV